MSPKTQKNTKTIIVGEGRGFDRIRRITGYLVGTTDRWNDAKRAEEHDRVKHSRSGTAKWKSAFPAS